MGKEYEFKIGDRVNVPQSDRCGTIMLIETKRHGNYSGYSSDIKTFYTVSVPFPNLRDTGYQNYRAEFEKSELTLVKSAY